MHNIHELMKIIKEVNSDGIINNKEVSFFQFWVDKNRNLAYDKKQSELIILIDTILKNRVIENDTRTVLLEKLEKLLSKVGDKSMNIYELHNIIEGIICDGKVNKFELYHLKKWMKENGNLIKGHKLTKDLYIIINDILEKNTITEEEWQNLLHLLSNIIKYTQFETKINYLCTQVKARKNIGLDLINILDNEFEISKIHDKAERYLLDALESESNFCINPEIIFISLVLIAMLKYDGNYYDNVRSTYTKVYQKYTEQKIEGFIRFLLNKYKKQNNSGSRTRIINVVLENAIVPQSFLSAFFEFIFDIYERNFEYDLPQDPYEDLLFVFEGLRSNILSEEKDIRLEVTQKTYKLIVATKQLIAREDGLDVVIKLSILIIKLIDKRFWYKDVKISNPYLKAGYEGWEKQLKKSIRGRHLQKNIASEFRTRWEPKFYMHNNTIYLNPPIHRIKAQYDYKDIEIVVLNDGEEIDRINSCDIRDIIGGYQINPQRIMVDRPLGKLIYRLMAGNEIIYDSKNKLHRNYIVFNADGQEINNNVDFEGTAFICYRKEEAEIENIISKEYYCIGYKLVKKGDIIAIGNDLFNFASMIKPGIFGQLHNNCFICRIGTKDYIPVYKEVKAVVFEADNSSIKFEVNINGKPYKLSELVHKTTVRDTITKYVVNLELMKCGIHTIEINQLFAGKKNRILREQFAYDNTLEFKAENLNDTTYRLKVVSNLLAEKVDTEITADRFDFDIIKFTSDGEEYNYVLPFNTGFYKIDEEEWVPTKEEIWIDDISLESTLKLYDSECDGLILYDENGTIVENDIEVKDKRFYKIASIGFLNSYKSSNKHVVLAFTVDGKVKYKIVCYNKCEIDEEATEIIFSDTPKKIMVTPIFHGKNKIFFELFNKDGKKVYVSKALSSGETEILDDFNSFEQYKFNFYEKTNNLILKNNTFLFSTEKTFYAREDYIGKVFKINTVYFDQFEHGNFKEKSYHFNKAYVRITEVIASDIFGGEIFVKKMIGEWKLDGVNPVEVELCSKTINDTMDVYITNCGDGLLLDSKKHGILNAMEHPTAPLIFYYTLSMKGDM